MPSSKSQNLDPKLLQRYLKPEKARSVLQALRRGPVNWAWDQAKYQNHLEQMFGIPLDQLDGSLNLLLENRDNSLQELYLDLLNQLQLPLQELSLLESPDSYRGNEAPVLDLVASRLERDQLQEWQDQDWG